MNREQKITRLQGLLDRVQTRAKEGRPAPRPVAAASPPAATYDLGFEIAPVAMPTSEPFDAEETRPFSKMPVVPPVKKPPVAEPIKAYDDHVEISVGTSEVEIDFDDVGEGGLEILGAADEGLFLDEEPPSSPRASARAMEDLELDIDEAPRVTPPPESGSQQVSGKPEVRLGSQPSQLEVDDTPPRGRLTTPERPSIEMLGQTVELPDIKLDEKLELDQKPIVAPLRDRPTGEMEAVIPGSMAPGVYPPHDREPFGGEPLTKDWDIPGEVVVKPPEPKTATPIPTGEVEVEQPSTMKPGALELDEAFGPIEAKPVEAKPVEAEPVEAKPVEAEPVEVKPVEAKPVEVEEAEPEAITKKPTELNLQELAAMDHAAAHRIETPPPPQPIHIEIAGKVITAPEMSQQDVAAFVGAVESTTSVTFLDVLDASLALGKD